MRDHSMQDPIHSPFLNLFDRAVKGMIRIIICVSQELPTFPQVSSLGPEPLGGWPSLRLKPRVQLSDIVQEYQCR